MRSPEPEQTRFRQSLRETKAERRLRHRLRDRRLAGLKFVRQESVGRYVADFRCRETRLIVEADGGQHADNAHDAARDARLTGSGYRVLRFWNAEIMSNIVGVTDTILAALLPSPRTRGEGRDDPVLGAASLEGVGEGSSTDEPRPAPPPHPRLPPRSGDERVVGALSPPAGRGGAQA